MYEGYLPDDGIDFYLFIEWSDKNVEGGTSRLGQFFPLYSEKTAAFANKVSTAEVQKLVNCFCQSLNFQKDQLAVVLTEEAVLQPLTNDEGRLKNCANINKFYYYGGDISIQSGDLAPYEELYKMRMKDSYSGRKAIAVILGHCFIRKYYENIHKVHEDWFQKCKEAGIEIITIGMEDPDASYKEPLDVERLKKMSTRKDLFYVGNCSNVEKYLTYLSAKLTSLRPGEKRDEKRFDPDDQIEGEAVHNSAHVSTYRRGKVWSILSLIVSISGLVLLVGVDDLLSLVGVFFAVLGKRRKETLANIALVASIIIFIYIMFNR